MVIFAFAFEDAKELGFVCEISNHIIGLATLVSIGKEIEAAMDHLDGNG